MAALLFGWQPTKLSDKGREGTVSPDGSQIVFLRGAPKSQELWLMDANGGGTRNSQASSATSFVRRYGLPMESKSHSCAAYTIPETLDVDLKLEILYLASNERRVVLEVA